MDKLSKFLNDPAAIEQFQEALRKFHQSVFAIGVALGEEMNKMYGFGKSSGVAEKEPIRMKNIRSYKQVKLNENEGKLPKKYKRGW